MDKKEENTEQQRPFVFITVAEFRAVIKETLSELLPTSPPGKPKSEKLRLITKKDVARHYGVSTVTIDKWSRHGVLPKPIKKGGRVYYLQSQLDVEIEQAGGAS